MRSPMRPNPSAPSQSVGALTKSLLVVEVRAAAMNRGSNTMPIPAKHGLTRKGGDRCDLKSGWQASAPHQPKGSFVHSEGDIDTTAGQPPV